MYWVEGIEVEAIGVKEAALAFARFNWAVVSTSFTRVLKVQDESRVLYGVNLWVGTSLGKPEYQYLGSKGPSEHLGAL